MAAVDDAVFETADGVVYRTDLVAFFLPVLRFVVRLPDRDEPAFFAALLSAETRRVPASTQARRAA